MVEPLLALVARVSDEYKAWAAAILASGFLGNMEYMLRPVWVEQLQTMLGGWRYDPARDAFLSPEYLKARPSHRLQRGIPPAKTVQS